MSSAAVIEHYTLDDFRRWKGDWELIRGVPLAMTPSPGVAHQRVARRFQRQFDEDFDDCTNCEVFYEIDVEFSADTVTRPDVLVICSPIDGDRITRAPALVALASSLPASEPCWGARLGENLDPMPPIPAWAPRGSSDDAARSTRRSCRRAIGT